MHILIWTSGFNFELRLPFLPHVILVFCLFYFQIFAASESYYALSCLLSSPFSWPFPFSGHLYPIYYLDSSFSSLQSHQLSRSQAFLYPESLNPSLLVYSSFCWNTSENYLWERDSRDINFLNHCIIENIFVLLWYLLDWLIEF